MYDHHAHVMWQQHERHVTAAAERRRSNLEAVERSRAEAQPDAAQGLVDVANAAMEASTRLATSVLRRSLSLRARRPRPGRP